MVDLLRGIEHRRNDWFAFPLQTWPGSRYIDRTQGSLAGVVDSNIDVNDEPVLHELWRSSQERAIGRDDHGPTVEDEFILGTHGVDIDHISTAGDCPVREHR